MSHKIATVVIVDADAPAFDQGETDENPSPVPSVNRINPRDAETNAPPITAGQETPEE